MEESEVYRYVDYLRNGSIVMIKRHASGKEDWVIEAPPDVFDGKIREIEDAIFDGT